MGNVKGILGIQGNPTSTVFQSNVLNNLRIVDNAAVEDQTLTVVTTGISDADGIGPFSYQWLRDSETITNATTTTYVLTQEDVTKDISVKVSYTDDEDNAETITSSAVWVSSNDATSILTNSGQSLGYALSINASLGDIDGDGDLDMVVAKGGAAGGGEYDTVWLNDGFGIFTDSGQSLGHESSKGVSLGDIDGDGDLDIAVANLGNSENKVYTNDGSGTFTDSLQSFGFVSSWDVTLGDIDGDGDLDMVVANFSVGNTVWLNDGFGIFTDSGQSIGEGRSYDISLSDIDGDGNLDMVVANFNPSIASYSEVWTNDGNGNFGNTSTQTPGIAHLSGQISVGDIDGDGDQDMVSGEAIKFRNSDPTGALSITGTATEDQTLTAVTSALSDADGLGSFSYQWIRAYSAIGDATSSTYTLGQSDVGNVIGVKVSYTDDEGNAESIFSSVTSVVVNLTHSPSGTITISGTVTEDQTLTAVTSALSDADGLGSFSYQWIRAGSDIGDATSSTYTLGQADVGNAISVKVSYTDGEGTAESTTSSPTSSVVGNAVIINGTIGDDIINGSSENDTIIGGAGHDIINAGDGNDAITLIGNSYYDGLTAHNVGSSSDVATNVKIDLSGKVKLETVIDGGADTDTINLGSDNDAFFLHDSFSGFNSSLTLTTDTHTGAQSTQRVLNVETINGLGGDDIIDLTSPDYSLAGQVITIDGGAGNDVIWGSDATETLIGGDGNDILFGGSGNDTLTGGSGADTFEFTRTAGSDTITDFQSGSDSIKIYTDYTFNVSKTGSTTSDYSIDGQSDPTLYLVRGKTYTFEMSGNGHPFYIKSTDATSGTADEYIDGVTRIGSANSGSDRDTLQFTATATTPDTLWYQCSSHSDMLGQLNIVDTLAQTLQTSGNNLIWNTLTIQSDTAFDLDDVSFVAIA